MTQMSGSHLTRERKARIVRYSKLRITVTVGPDAGAHVDMAGTPIRIGTAPDNDLVLTDKTVSRRHCEIEPGDTGIRVRDAGSTNGILLGDLRLYDAIVSVGATLRLGETVFTITELGQT